MKGIYILTIVLSKSASIKIGALGEIDFEKGTYAYVGSAQNNLEKRVQRHFKKDKKLRWHIDYLTTSKYAKVENVFYKIAPKKEECKTAEYFAKTQISIKNFGCSDCKCKSHLFKINKNQIPKSFLLDATNSSS